MAVLIDALEARRLFATTWSTYAQLIGQDDAAVKYGDLTGAGQTVAIVDTGVDYTHSSLGGGFGGNNKVVSGYDFVDGDDNPMDEDGHGTQVAGMVAANRFTKDGVTYQGIAPDAKLIALRTGTDEGFTDANIQAALNWVIDNQVKYNITVVNMSLGGGNFEGTQSRNQWQDELKRLADLDVAIIAASGNDGEFSRGTTGHPASDPAVHAIGSISAQNEVSDFSERGAELDLLAPGEQVVSTSMGGGYDAVNGTSFSAPLVAGVFALLGQQTSRLSQADMMSVLRSSSNTQYDGDGDPGLATQRSYAQLDLVAALDLSKIRESTQTHESFPAARHTTFDADYDVNGVLHLAYFDSATRTLKYSTQVANGKWTTPVTIDKSPDVGTYLSLAIDPTGKPAVSYQDGRNKDLKYAWFTGERWSNTTLDDRGNVGQFTSLVFSSDADPSIAYYRETSTDLRLVQYDRSTGKWTRDTIDSVGDVGRYASIGYFRDSSFVTNDSGASTGINVETLAIAYADDTNGSLKYYRTSTAAASTGGGELRAVVDDLDGVGHIDLSLVDVNGIGALRIAYQDTKQSDVKFAYRENGTFVTKTIARAGSVGSNIESYVDGNGTYRIVYYDKSRKGSYNASINSVYDVTGVGRIGTAGSYGVIAASPSADIVALVGLNRTAKSFSAIRIV